MLNTMKIAVIGTSGFVGSHITKELLSRDYDVIGISKDIKISQEEHLSYVKVDILDLVELTKALKDCEVVVSAFNAGWDNPNLYEDFLSGSKAIQEAVKTAGINRFIVIGGAGSLYVSDGVQAVDTADFPKEFYNGALAARDYYNILEKENNIDWAVFCPPFEMHKGVTIGRTGKYRLGHSTPIYDERNRSVLSVEDLAVVIADEIENKTFSKTRFTAAY